MTSKPLKEHLGQRRHEEPGVDEGGVNNPSARIKEIFCTIDVNAK